jgi:hypothetical protein
MRVFSCPGAVVLAVDIAAEMEPGFIREKYNKLTNTTVTVPKIQY